MNDFQTQAYQLTINNPVSRGYSHSEIKQRIMQNFTTIQFFCMADEIGEQQTPHTHLYLYFRSRVRFSMIKRYFPEAHIEKAYGTPQNNVDYIKKTGKWEDSKKSKTSVLGTYESWGNFPSQDGKRNDLRQLFQMIDAGFSNAEILTRNNDLILNIDKIDKVRTTLLIDEYKDKLRLDLHVVYISGATGTGKTRTVVEKYGGSQIYRVTDYEHPFDHYACQPIMVFDEYRSNFRISDILQYCDIYPIQLKARYSNKVACYNEVYIISNWSLEEQYKEVQQAHPESWKAFLRRIHEVHIYESDGTKKIYDSVESYLNREPQFTPMSDVEQLDLPFGKESD